MAHVTDVAAYVLSKAGPMTAMKLQKLCYYSQAWSLVWDEAPLFDEPIQAWANGPVIPVLYQQHRGSFTVTQMAGGDPQMLTPDQAETVNVVLDSYGDLTAQQLSALTHAESPWIEARRGLAPTERGCVEITRESMTKYYSALVDRDDTEAV